MKDLFETAYAHKLQSGGLAFIWASFWAIIGFMIASRVIAEDVLEKFDPDYPRPRCMECGERLADGHKSNCDWDFAARKV